MILLLHICSLKDCIISLFIFLIKLFFYNKKIQISLLLYLKKFKLQLKGSVDDCACNVDTVDHFNNMRIYPRIQSLLVRDYFRFYKVNLKQDCPFWADDSKCAIRYCHVLPCQEVSIF